MKAITVKPTWAWAIIYAGKNIENRSWQTRIRGPVAIHASKNLSRKEYEESKKLFSRRWRNELPAYEYLARGAMICVTEIIDCVTESKLPWFMSDYGFERAQRARPCAEI